MPFCYDGTNDMFEAQAWDMDQYTKDCQETWGVTPRPALADTLYGGRSLEAASNIVFSNGLLDPWSSGGVLKPVGGTAALIIPEGAHHLDLRAANPKDPVSVVDARKKERWERECSSFRNPIHLTGNSLRSGLSSGRTTERSLTGLAYMDQSKPTTHTDVTIFWGFHISNPTLYLLEKWK